MHERLGRYEIKEELGRGTMGIVYRAYDPRLERVVVLKTLRRDGIPIAEREESVVRFHREARAVGVLSHPGIVAIHDVDEDQGELFLAMEYVPGTTLQSLLADRVRLPVSDVVRQMAEVAEALDYAHARKIIHRDIKPANLLLSPSGRVKIVDFGLARVAASTLTGTGQALGTPHYMSPEQFVGEPLDGRSDLFSLGVVAYQMLTLAHPFAAKDFNTMVHRILTLVPRAPHEMSGEIPPALSAVVLKAMSKKREERYGRGREMAVALRGAMEGAPKVEESQAMMMPEPGEEPTVMAPISATIVASGSFDDPFGSGPVTAPSVEKTVMAEAVRPAPPTIAPAQRGASPPPARGARPVARSPLQLALWALVAMLGIGSLLAVAGLVVVVLWPSKSQVEVPVQKPAELLAQRHYKELELWALKRMEQNPNDPEARAYLELARAGLRAGSGALAQLKVSQIKVNVSAPYSGTLNVAVDSITVIDGKFTAQASTLFGRPIPGTTRPASAHYETYIAAGRHKVTLWVKSKSGRTNLTKDLLVDFPASSAAVLTVEATAKAIDVGVR